LLAVALARAISVTGAFPSEAQPAQYRGRLRSGIAPGPGREVDGVPELRGRRERHHLGGVLGSDLEEREVQLLVWDGLDERLGIGRRQEDVELVLADRGGEGPPRRERPAAIRIHEDPLLRRLDDLSRLEAAGADAQVRPP